MCKGMSTKTAPTYCPERVSRPQCRSGSSKDVSCLAELKKYNSEFEKGLEFVVVRGKCWRGGSHTERKPLRCAESP